MRKLVALVLFTSMGLGGCSVYMASTKKGTDFEDLVACKTKTCLLAHGAEPLQVQGLPPDTEAFKVLKSQGSYGRAFMHGLLDVATIGLWEVAGTPIEGSFDRNRYYAIRVRFELGSENVSQIAIAD